MYILAEEFNSVVKQRALGDYISQDDGAVKTLVKQIHIKVKSELDNFSAGVVEVIQETIQ